MVTRYLHKLSIIVIAIMALSVFASAQTSPKTDFPNIKIGNFGQIDEHYYRGAQPEPGDYVSLAALGVKTVIDLRDDPRDYEKAAVEKAGMTYVNIPMSGWRTPRDESVNTFLKLANDPATGTIFVHCKAGIHRTGITAAVYRFTKFGWGYDQAFVEMKNYNFYTGWIHGALKTYVKRYAERLRVEKRNTAQVLTAAVIK